METKVESVRLAGMWRAAFGTDFFSLARSPWQMQDCRLQGKGGASMGHGAAGIR